jgi:heme exporter protein CcmD
MMPDMGKYGFFVWTTYGSAAVIMLGLVAYYWLTFRKNQKALHDLTHQDHAGHAANSTPDNGKMHP